MCFIYFKSKLFIWSKKVDSNITSDDSVGKKGVCLCPLLDRFLVFVLNSCLGMVDNYFIDGRFRILQHIYTELIVSLLIVHIIKLKESSPSKQRSLSSQTVTFVNSKSTTTENTLVT